MEMMKLSLCIVALIALWQGFRRLPDWIRPARPATEAVQSVRQPTPAARPVHQQAVIVARPAATEPQPHPARLTPEERYRQQLRAEEAMKIIEASTPEM